MLVAAAALALAITAGATAGTHRHAAKDPLAALVAKSKTESGIVVYGNPPAANFNALVAKFNAVYPWIKVTEYDLSDQDIFSKYGSESAQGVRTADILIASAPNYWGYAARKQYASHITPLGLDKYPSWVKQYKGVFVMSPDPAIIVYNKLILKDKVPTSIAEMANDSGTYTKLTGYPVDNTFGYTGLYGYVHLAGWGNFEKIGKRLTPASGVSSQLQLVAQGGAVAAYLTSPTARFRIASDPKLTDILGWSYVKDGTPLIPRGIAVTKKAASPASAQLFLDYVFSAAGQQAMCDAGFTAYMKGFTASNGCQNTLADVYKNVGAKNVYLAGFNRAFVVASIDFAKRWHGIFG